MCPEDQPQSSPDVDLTPSDRPIDVPPPVPGESMVGVGEMPADAFRFNWGAFLMPGVWGIVYGVWPLIGLWVVSLIVPIAVASLFTGSGSAASSELSALIAATVVSETFVGIVRLWSGMSAHRLLWMRERRRMEWVPGSGPRIPLTRFLRRQRAWAIWGVILLVPAFVINGPLMVAEWQKYGLGPIGALEPFVWLAVEVALGLWLGRRMRIDGPDAAPAEGRA